MEMNEEDLDALLWLFIGQDRGHDDALTDLAEAPPEVRKIWVEKGRAYREAEKRFVDSLKVGYWPENWEDMK